MQKKKRLIFSALCLLLILFLTGCNPNQQAIFDASMKMQTINSAQEHITMSLKLSGSGFDPSIQEQIDSMAVMLNDATLDMDIKSVTNEEKTAAQAELDMKVSMPGLEINMPYWVDMDLTASQPKMVEIFKIPEIATPYLPPEAMGKEYLVMNLTDMNNQDLNTIDMAKLMEFSTGFQEKYLDFLAGYAQRFNPNIDVVKETVDSNTDQYIIHMNDAQFKEFISYTINNLAQDEEGIDFLKDYMQSMAELGRVPESAEGYDDFEQALEEMDAGIPEFLEQFNLVMEQLENVRLLGDEGVQLTFTISDGYIVKTDGLINLTLDMQAISELMDIPAEDEDMMPKGTLDLVIEFKDEVISINQPLEIQIPEVNADNSLDYFDLFAIMDPEVAEPIAPEPAEPIATEPAEPMAPEPKAPVSAPGTYTVKAGDTLGTIALNHYGSYQDATKIYQANLETFKKSSNRLDAGMVLVLPKEGLLSPLPTENVKQVYTVKAGDTLGIIAEKMYGDPSLYTKIFEANKERLANPNMIYEGQWLVIPN